MKEEEKIFAGKFFCPGHPDLKAIKLRCHNLCSAYNATLEDETEKRNAIVHQIFGDFGEGSFVQGPIQIHYGTHTHIGKSFFGKPRIMVCIPTGITSVEKRAVLEAAMQAGASKTYLIEEPLAAALGAGLDISVPSGSMVIDIGGGTTDIAILSLGGVVVDSSIRVGGDAFDEAIVRYVKKVYNVLIGEPTAEKIKMNVATVLSNGKCTDMEVQGRDLIAGRPTTIKVTSADARAALREPVYSIIGTIRGVLEKCPPELSADIVDKGMVLTGGGALVDGLAQLLTEETGIKTTVAENPLDCVALGTGKALSELNNLRPGSVVGNA